MGPRVLGQAAGGPLRGSPPKGKVDPWRAPDSVPRQPCLQGHPMVLHPGQSGHDPSPAGIKGDPTLAVRREAVGVAPFHGGP